MVVAFTVHPCCGGSSLLLNKINRYGPLAHMMSDLSGWLDCYRKYYVFLQAVTVDPFHPSVVGPTPTQLSSGEGGGDDAILKYLTFEEMDSRR
jgi:hypothetical protein